ncbi:MAG: hypothetical protein ABIK09_12000 [Pseudomonadota bacterium]
MRPHVLLLMLVLSWSCAGPGGSGTDSGPDAKIDAAPTEDVPSEDAPADASPDVPSPADALDAVAPPDLLDAVDAADPEDAVDAIDVPDLVPDVLPDVPPPPPEDWWPLGEVTGTCAGGFSALAESPSGALQILVLTGSHWDMGYQHGCLGGPGLAAFWQQFLAYFLEEIEGPAAEIGIPPDALELMLMNLMINLWDHVAPFVPPAYVEEIQGFAAGAEDAGVVIQGWDIEMAVKGLILLANVSDLNFSGSMEEVIAKLSEGYSPALTGYYEDEVAGALLQLLRHGPRRSRVKPTFATSCSFFGAWGDRTQDGHYLGSRILDWSTDTGIQNLKGLVFYVPSSGHAHVAVGYLGFVGALAGMSERGVVLSEVGSGSVMERLKGQPWVLKFREVMETADDLDEALGLALGVDPQEPLRPMTIGYNFAIGYGDPDGGGAGACGAVLETNGLAAAVQRHGPDCAVHASVTRYDLAGNPVELLTDQDAPALSNLEADAVEVDALGQPRLFQVDQAGQHVLDEDGWPILDPDGAPYPVGKILPCAFYRGDEALTHGIRRWQTASNGPQETSSLLVQSGSYRHRYALMANAIKALAGGVAYVHDGTETIPDNGGVPVPLGLDQGEWIARGAAMGSNVMAIVYDATALELRVTWEKGEGDTWEKAVAHDFLHVPVGDLIGLVKANTPQ